MKDKKNVLEMQCKLIQMSRSLSRDVNSSCIKIMIFY